MSRAPSIAGDRLSGDGSDYSDGTGPCDLAPVPRAAILAPTLGTRARARRPPGEHSPVGVSRARLAANRAAFAGVDAVTETHILGLKATRHARYSIFSLTSGEQSWHERRAAAAFPRMARGFWLADGWWVGTGARGWGSVVRTSRRRSSALGNSRYSSGRSLSLRLVLRDPLLDRPDLVHEELAYDALL